MNLLLLVIKTQSYPELLVWCVKQPISLYGNFRLCLILTLIGRNLDIRDEVISESVRQLSEVLTIDANIKHVEGILMIEVRNVRNLA